MRPRAIGQSERGRISSRALVLAVLVLVLASIVVWGAGCESDEDVTGLATSSTEVEGAQSGDVEGVMGETITVADVRVTVKALEATFQPAQPVQRLSEETPAAPSSGESFYQAYVRVENRGEAPVRVEPREFACLVGDGVVAVEPTRSGPLARSILKNTSLDLILTFKAKAGFVPVLLYSPSWYQGTITVAPAPAESAEG